MNGFAALDTAVGICSPAIKRCVAAPSPEFWCATSFYQRQICEKYLTVPNDIPYGKRFAVSCVRLSQRGRYDAMLTFFIGLFVGGVVGVFTMCLFQINRK